ncbi:hypothetical protein LCGC14_1037280 [marine sediment metagenome]|uniref:Uncharacterized protein n=1 Tax=marine sediment metagenome TaxID=412755 RepID=A0A0F9NEG5_9ZZZZ
MYCTKAVAKTMLCWKTIGTNNERNCWCDFCHAWDDLVEVKFLDRCPHCDKTIKGSDVLGAIADNPLGYCSATKRR